MTYNNLSEIFDAMDKTRAHLRARLEHLTGEEENARPSPEAWSAKEIAEHLAIIEERLSKLFPVMVTKAEAGGLQRRADQPFRPISVESMIERSKREKYVAPDEVRPTGAGSIPDSIARLTRSRETIHALRPRIEALDLSSVTYPHPVFGQLNTYQWLIFLAAHEGRHLRQIESAVTTPETDAKGA